MADMLKFRKGLFADLPEAKTAGTIYVTTDEQAMYVDVSASQRVRVGDIIQKNSVREATPPYSTDALYYFIEENALLKWGPFGKDGEMAWKQLNSVSDITADLTDVKSRLSDAETAITKLNGNSTVVGSVDYKIAAAQKTLSDSITAVDGKVDELANGQVATNKTNIEALRSDLNQAQTDISTNAANIQTNVNAIAKLNGTGEGSVAKAVADAKTELQGKIDTANGKITTNTNDIAGLATRVTTAEGTIANHETLLTKLDGDENTTGSVKAQIKAAKEALSAEIDKDINAANAMNYIGAVATYAALPTEGVHVGDTYVVSTKFTQGSETYHAGDLVVATGDENDSGVITANLAWNHVKTGYIGEHESKLTGADNALKLTSYLGDDLGTVTFKSASADEGGVVVTVAGNQVSIDFEWGTF